MTRYLKRGISLGLALGNITKKKARSIIKRAIAKSDVNKKKASELARILLKETLIEQKRIRKALQHEAKSELKKALRASRKEVERLNRKIKTFSKKNKAKRKHRK